MFLLKIFIFFIKLLDDISFCINLLFLFLFVFFDTFLEEFFLIVHEMQLLFI